MIRTACIVVILVSICFNAIANNSTLRIGLFDGEEPNSIIVSKKSGSYDIIADGQNIGSLNNITYIKVIASSGKLIVKSPEKQIGNFTKVFLKRTKWGGTLGIKPVIPNKTEHEYPDHITLTAFGSKIRTVNSVFIEHYVSGVIESEAGSKQSLEYYKVQAIICRTYALANKRRHLQEGFQLCDKVHCQVFHGKSKSNPDIVKATKETKGTVIVDSDINLITAGFHSNCGGQTVNSEDVWRKPVDYLKSVCDTFCTDMPHAIWTKTISTQSWFNYLGKYYNYPTNDSTYICCALDHSPDHRETCLTSIDSSITLTNIRRDWELRSTHFHIEHQQDSIKFIGSGFGHGIGLCQEGAMKMANYGYKYNEILHYYYSDIHLVNLSFIDFFRD